MLAIENILADLLLKSIHSQFTGVFLFDQTHRLLLLVHVACLGQLDISGAQFSIGGELDAVLGARDHDGVADLREVTADACKLP